MGYLINESRLKQVINNFITENVGSLTLHKHSAFNLLVWRNQHGEEIFLYDKDEDDGLGISHILFNTVMNFFNLNEEQTINIFVEWIHQNYGIKITNGGFIYDE
jgi:hypothetical protein